MQPTRRTTITMTQIEYERYCTLKEKTGVSYMSVFRAGMEAYEKKLSKDQKEK